MPIDTAVNLHTRQCPNKQPVVQMSAFASIHSDSTIPDAITPTFTSSSANFLCVDPVAHTDIRTELLGAMPAVTDAQADTGVIKLKGAWSKEENQMLEAAVFQLGPTKWYNVASRVPGRSAKQCRERWHNHLNPEINKGRWQPEEDSFIKEAFLLVGPSWATIALALPHRTDSSVKNRFHSYIKRSMLYKGKSEVESCKKIMFAPESPEVFSCKTRSAPGAVDRCRQQEKNMKRVNTTEKRKCLFTFDFDSSLPEETDQEEYHAIVHRLMDIKGKDDEIDKLLTDKKKNSRCVTREGRKAKRKLEHMLTKSSEKAHLLQPEIDLIDSVFPASFDKEEATPRTMSTKGSFTMRTVEVVSKLPGTVTRSVFTPFKSVAERQEHVCTPLFGSINMSVARAEHSLPFMF